MYPPLYKHLCEFKERETLSHLRPPCDVVLVASRESIRGLLLCRLLPALHFADMAGSRD